MRGTNTKAELTADLARVGTIAGLAREYGISRTTLQKRLGRFGIQSPTRTGQHSPHDRTAPLASESVGTTINGDTATVTIPADSPWTLDEIARESKLDPDEWIATRAQPNVWQGLAPEGVIVDLHQLKVEFTRRIPADMLLPARTDGWTPKRTAHRPRPKTSTTLIAVVSDTHAPYHDHGLHNCFLQWLDANQPERAYDFGDLLDLPTPSRHRTTKGFEASPQESVDARYRLDAERVAASTNTAWTVVYGNHDERIEHAIHDKIGAHVARLCRAEQSLPVMDLGYLLRYDELGIEVVRPSGDYHSVTVEIAPGLFGRHGTKAGKHGGAVKAIERRASSLGQGHDHKMVSQQHVRYDAHGNAQTAWTFSWGAMCSRDLGYVEDPDVAQGFSTITLHKSGRWHHEFAAYDDAAKTLTWRDQVFTPR